MVVDYKKILQLDAAGVTGRGIADVLSCSRNTVASVLRMAEVRGVVPMTTSPAWSPPTVEQVRNLHALIERRTGVSSTIFASQIPPAKWHDQIEEKVIADAICDRITANAHKMTLTCKDSLRRVFKPID